VSVRRDGPALEADQELSPAAEDNVVEGPWQEVDAPKHVWSKAAKKQFDRVERKMQELDEEFFISEHGGKARVVRYKDRYGNPVDELAFYTITAFRATRSHEVVRVPTLKPVAPGQRIEVMEEVAAAVHWQHRKDTRRIRVIDVLPGQEVNNDHWNLWQGWATAAAAGDWRMTEEFLREIICAGDEANYEWLLGWLAYCVQRPERQAEVALILKGLKGTGKGAFGRLLKRFFGRHQLKISNHRHLTGNFNAHLLGKLVLFVDEAFWAGDRRGEPELKSMITEDTLFIEPKNLNGYEAPNRLKIIMASNKDWVIPATYDERRFFVLEVSEAHLQDTAYFAALEQAWDSGEAAALLHFLLAYDLSGFDHRNPPHTAGLNEQKIQSFEHLDGYWYERLTAGEIEERGGWPELLNKSTIYDGYVKFCKLHNRRGTPLTDNVFFRDLRKRVPGAKDVRPRSLGKKPFLQVPELEVCRAGFAAHHKIPEAQLFPEGDQG
jgi:Family of unknown function (DUF5906)